MSEKTITIKRDVKILIPRRPNFITVGLEVVNTSEIDKETLKLIGEAWTKALIEESFNKRMADTP